MNQSKDRQIWHLYTKNVKRLRSAKSLLFPNYPTKPSGTAVRNEALETKASAARKKNMKQRDEKAPEQYAGQKKPPVSLDKRMERKLKRGHIEIEASIDLHGMTQAEAQAAFRKFVETQRAKGRRRLLVITGKGRGEKPVLRTSLPRWCADDPVLAQDLLALRPAAPAHGGTGAWYVILRRRRV